LEGGRAGHHRIQPLLALKGARVIDVRCGAEAIIVCVALSRRRLVCSLCGQVYRARYDGARRRWRHLDVAGRHCFVGVRAAARGVP
jgi:hypothetical protein